MWENGLNRRRMVSLLTDRKHNSSFKTKDTLREEYIQLTTEITTLKQRYEKIYPSFATLSASYSNCKEHNAFLRYGDLKEMIKACVKDEVKQTSDGKGKALAEFRKSSATINKIYQLHKAEIVKGIEDTQKLKSKLERNLLQLQDMLEKLKRDYEVSKQYMPPKRYRVMKRMIKPLIRNEALKDDLECFI